MKLAKIYTLRKYPILWLICGINGSWQKIINFQKILLDLSWHLKVATKGTKQPAAAIWLQYKKSVANNTMGSQPIKFQIAVSEN